MPCSARSSSWSASSSGGGLLVEVDEGVDADAVRFEGVDGAHDAVERVGSVGCRAANVVNGFGAVDGDEHLLDGAAYEQIGRGIVDARTVREHHGGVFDVVLDAPCHEHAGGVLDSAEREGGVSAVPLHFESREPVALVHRLNEVAHGAHHAVVHDARRRFVVFLVAVRAAQVAGVGGCQAQGERAAVLLGGAVCAMKRAELVRVICHGEARGGELRDRLARLIGALHCVSMCRRSWALLAGGSFCGQRVPGAPRFLVGDGEGSRGGMVKQVLLAGSLGGQGVA